MLKLKVVIFKEDARCDWGPFLASEEAIDFLSYMNYSKGGLGGWIEDVRGNEECLVNPAYSGWSKGKGMSDGKCPTCRDPDHDQCPLITKCSCCLWTALESD